MFRYFQNFFAVPVFSNDEEKIRVAELLNTILNSMIVLSTISLLALLLGGTDLYLTYYLVAAFTAILVVLRIPFRRGYVKLVSYIVIFLFTFVLTFALASGGTIRAPGVALFLLTVIISGLVIGRRAAYWVAGINIVIFLTLLILEINGRLPEPVTTVNVQQAIIFSIATILSARLLALASKRVNESLERARLGEEKLSVLNLELEQRVNERTAKLEENSRQLEKRASQLEAIADTARFGATIGSLDKLLPGITRNISEKFGFYHIGIFLLDDAKEFAVLRAANSLGGQAMLAKGHRLRIGQQGIVGFVTLRGQPRVALNVGDETIYFNNPDLPDTQSEVALPLKFGEQIIGALDIQSTEKNAFNQEDLEIFNILADQVSVAIQNAQSLELTQRALHEVEIASSQLTKQAWEGYSQEITSRGYRYDGIKPEPLQPAGKSKKVAGVGFPVQLRGQVIGQLNLNALDGDRHFSDDELAIIQSTADRVALALEGARLLEDAQKRANRETFLSSIGSKLGASFQLDSILRDTVEELGNTFKGSRITFQLVNPKENVKTNANDESQPKSKKDMDQG